MNITHFFDKETSTLTYVIAEEGGQAIVIDPVLNFEPASGRISENSVKLVVDHLCSNNLQPILCIETHAHADHLSGSQVLKKQFPELKVAVSKRIVQVQEKFNAVFNFDAPADGSQFDYLFEDGEKMEIGTLNIEVIPTPGHTPACTSFLINGTLFVGDAIFMPDFGVGRCDFPGGSAKQMFNSIMKNIYTLPEHTPIYVGHDYQPNGRQLQYKTTIKDQKQKNIHITSSTSESEFVQRREARDKTLNAPRLLLQSLQTNILAGHLPEPESNGQRYLKIPLKVDI